MSPEELEALCDRIDVAISWLSVADAIEAVEYVQAHCSGILVGLRDDVRRGFG